MTEQRHIIKRQVIELTVRDAAQASRLHDEVSRIYRERIVPLIDRYCAELSAPDRLHRIERLELDLGAIDERRLEADLVARVSAALYPALAARIGEQEHGRPDQSPEALSQLELLALFARTGSLPWWADATAPRLLERGLRHLLERAPEPLRRLMRELAREQPALRRIVDHLPDELLAMLAVSLAPAIQGQPANDLQASIKLLQGTQAGAGRTPAELRRSTWMIILHVAGVAGPQYSAAPFYQAVLRRVASELGATYGALLADLRQVARAGGEYGPGALGELLDALEREPAESHDNTAPAPTRPADDRAFLAELLAALSELQGAAPAPATAQRILRLLQSEPARQALSPEELSSLTHILRAAMNADPAHSAEELSNLTHMLHAALNPDPAPSAAETTVDLRFSDADELYIGNAGLVILWPFLGGFFARLGLLEGKRFKDSASQQRAAGLLQHIATGHPAFPEYLLPLNKLLCGLGLAEVFDFGAPLLASEAAECAGMLRTAIAQAPILRDMSPDGFRGTFLLRPGVLSARDGAWLLRVERRTYDLVLDRFPWGWEWVKLPWMAAPLRVEW